MAVDETEYSAPIESNAALILLAADERGFTRIRILILLFADLAREMAVDEN
jgi:hypothetical protein